MENAIIISDGTAHGTKVKIGDKVLHGITKIEIEPLEVGGFVRARISFNAVALKMRLANADIECPDRLTEQNIKDALLRFAQEAESAEREGKQ